MLRTAVAAPPRRSSRPPPRRPTSRCSRTRRRPGSFTRLDVRVPNERDDASTTKVEVQLPDGFASASYEPVPGWTVKVTNGPAGQRRSRPTTARSPRASSRSRGRPTATTTAIPPGAFQDFGLSVQVPGKAGDKLEFKALQTYSRRRGRALDRRRGLRQPGPDRHRRRAAGTDAASHGGGDAGATTRPRRRRTRRRRPSDDDAGNGLAIVALIVGALGLVAGGAGLLAAAPR